MDDTSKQILSAICEMRDLIRLMAEPQIAARDQKFRDELKRIVGKSLQKAKSVMLMDGNHTQSNFSKQTGISSGNISTLIKELGKSQLLSGDPKKPKLAFPIPGNFFDQLGGAHE